LIIGLTGGIACGKSTVSALFEALGVPVIDADTCAHELVQPGTPVLRAIVEHFGRELLLENGTLNRRQLGKLIFADDVKRKALETLLHPLIRHAMLEKAKQFQDHPYLIFVIPLLFETGQRDLVDSVLLVDCSEETQLKRLMTRNRISEEEARQMIAAQASRMQRISIADDILINESEQDRDRLAERVRQLHGHYLHRALANRPPFPLPDPPDP